MAKKYVIAIDHGTDTQRNAITNYLRPLGGFWHWMADLWLFIPNMPTQHNAASIRNGIREVAPTVPAIVLPVEVSATPDWSGQFPTKWAEWLQSFWH
jgi:hypothetical protein